MYRVEEFESHLCNSLGIEVTCETVLDSNEFCNDYFTLSFTVENGYLNIRTLINHDSPELGRKLIEIIHDYVEDCDLSIMASDVTGKAVFFWEAMGYEREQGSRDFYRI